MFNIADYLKIIVVFHKRYPSCPIMLQKPDVYVPILAGKSDVTKDIEPFIKGMHCDNEGNDNISWMNPYFNEITGMYWAWRHFDKIGNPRFIGTHHYRRFFEPKDVIEVFKGKIVVNMEKEYFEEASVLNYFFGANIIDNMIKLVHTNLDMNNEFVKKCFTEFMQWDYQYNREMFVCPWGIFDALMRYLVGMFPYLSQHVYYGHPYPKYYRNMSYVIEVMVGFFFYCLEKSGMFKLHKASYFYFRPEGYEK